MSAIEFPGRKCTISDDWTYKNMKVVYMENDYLRIGILVGRGSDIFEFYYKPRAIDFMLRLKKGIQNPNEVFSQVRSTPNQMEDYYYGGWQEALPNSPTFNYRGAELGQHGEVHLLPWKHAIIRDTDEEVILKLWTSPLRVPVRVEKTITMRFDTPQIVFRENLINESSTDLDLMWGHHIAFGLPFLHDGGFIETNAKDFLAEPTMPDLRRFSAGSTQKWPMVLDVNGAIDDASSIPPADKDHYSDLAYLTGFENEAFYTLWNGSKNLGFKVQWDPKVFTTLWYWQERYATQDAPWWGSVYALGLEFWTSKWTSEPLKAIEEGKWMRLAGKDQLETTFTTSIEDKMIH
jgi:hypothetical protein